MDEHYRHLVEALQRPDTYANEGVGVREPIEVVETHVSHLFLTGGYVYKLKKPVDLGFVDLTTLEERRANCERELDLNRRLSPDVYLGVLPLVEAEDGVLTVGGSGEAIDYVVKMRQLPRDRMLDALLKRNAVAPGDIRAIARRIADFHATAARSAEVTQIGGRAGVLHRIEENFRQTLPSLGEDLPLPSYDDIAAYSHAFFNTNDDLMRRREEDGNVVDGHGDLHAAQICLLDDAIEFIDCIEFSEAYRYGDVALDLAFLAMDLDHYERRDLSGLLVETYAEASGDAGLHEVLGVYKCYRAYVRGKVANITAENANLGERERDSAKALAHSYYDLAHSYALDALPQRSLFCVMGLSGTGKSTLARQLAEHWGIPHFSSDVERKRIAGAGLSGQRSWGVGEGLYSKEMDARTYDALFDRARQALSQSSVILDATLRDASMRARAADLASTMGAQAWFIECVAPDDVIKRRIDARSSEGTDPSDATWEVYLDQRRGWHGAGDVSPAWHIVVDTSASPQEVLRSALLSMFERAVAP